MARVRIPDERRDLTEFEEVRDYLAGIGIEHERGQTDAMVPRDATSEQVLNAYSAEIDRLKQKGSYTTADVIDISPDTPGLEAMLARFNIEHSHDEDEVRFILAGRGLFHIHPQQGPVVAIEVGAGDLIRAPRNTLDWFDLCGDRPIASILLFQDASGWTPLYTNSGVDRKFELVCWGPAYVRPQSAAE